MPLVPIQSPNKNISKDKTVIQSFKPTLSTSPNPSTVSATDNSDIRVYPSSHSQSEVHISLDINNPDNLLISANTYTNTYQQGYYVSNNGGSSWTGSDELENSSGSLGGDPSTAFGADGTAYISTMTYPINGYYLQKSTNGGSSWSSLNRGVTESGFDKEMIAVDNVSGSSYANNFYNAWTDFGNNVRVRFNRSTDGGSTFSSPITFKNGFGQGTNVQTGPNGEVYVCWADYTDGNIPADNIGFAKSLDGGATFSSAKLAFSYDGIRDQNGTDSDFNIRMNDFPSMAVDKSNSSHRGRIYIAYPAKEGGNGKSIIQVRHSDNKGDTWSSPQTVSISAGAQNFFPWIAVDATNGWVSVVYYSFDGSGYSTNTYVSYSMDGGQTFQNIKVSDLSHQSAAINNSVFSGGYAGDYIGIAAYNGKAYPTWMDDRNGTWQIYVSPVTLSPPPLSVSVAGPHFLRSGEQGTWVASVFNNKGPITYKWYRRVTPSSSFYFDGGTEQTYNTSFTNYGPQDVEAAVKVEVTSAGETATTSPYVVYISPDCNSSAFASSDSVTTNIPEPCN